MVNIQVLLSFCLMNKLCIDLVTSMDNVCVSVSRSFDHTINAKDKIKKKFILPVSLTVLAVILQHVILFLVARTQPHFCTAVLFVCLGCDKMK